jgi:hypothetical protein
MECSIQEEQRSQLQHSESLKTHNNCDWFHMAIFFVITIEGRWDTRHDFFAEKFALP